MSGEWEQSQWLDEKPILLRARSTLQCACVPSGPAVFIFPQAQQYSCEVLSVCGLKTGFVIHGRVWKTSLGMLSRKVVILRQALAT